MQEQIFYCKSKGVRIPVQLEVFKHGPSFYLAYVNHEENVHVPLIGSASAWLAEFSRAQELIATASRERDQGHISRAGNGVKPPAPKPESRRAPTAPNWDWLTPEMVIEYFQKSPVLHYITDDVKAALGPLIGMAYAATLPIAPSQLELDLETVRPHIDRITTNGKVNKSEIARVLGIKASGPGNWARLTEIADFISSSSFSPTSRPAISDEKKRSAAA